MKFIVSYLLKLTFLLTLYSLSWSLKKKSDKALKEEILFSQVARILTGNVLKNVLGGDYMIPVSRDEILSCFAGILAVL